MARLMVHRNILKTFHKLPSKVQKRVSGLIEEFHHDPQSPANNAMGGEQSGQASSANASSSICSLKYSTLGIAAGSGNPEAANSCTYGRRLGMTASSTGCQLHNTFAPHSKTAWP